MGIFDRFRGRSKAPENPAPLQPVRAELPLRSSGEGLAAAMGDFGLELSRQQPGNTVCSALSIYEAWLRVWAGAREACRAELKEALGLGEAAEVREGLAAMIDGATRPRPDCSVRTANAIWVKPGFRIDQAFEDQWGGATRELDFSGAARAAETINRWVAERTNGMIRDLLDERAIVPEMAMILANAIHLKAKWAQTFEGWRTCDLPFATAGGRSVEVPTMWDCGHYRCVRTDDFELLRKPYVGDALEFVVLLPGPGRFEAVRAGLSFATVRRAVAAAEGVDTILRMPRFSIESSPEVDPVLRSRGATAVYGPRTANLSGLSPDALRPGEELFVSETTHKARIDVDEEGTEAAAATAIAAPGGAAPGVQAPPYAFTVDRPFLFFVVERSTGAPLFSGHVVDPSAA